MTNNADEYFATRQRLALPDVEMHDLAIVVIGATVRERIQQRFLRVVAIATAMIGRIQIDKHFQRTSDRPDAVSRQDRADRGAECPTLAVDERPCSNPPPVMVHRRRIRQFQFGHDGRLQGGVFLTACCGCPGSASALA